ncbi:MAG: hypothetical protein J6V72_10405, partial [Kiritimatiellae bacterium]|nr:hypothetical protein [Kiritimatiellia bacterium]
DMYCIGIDPGKHTGIAVWNTETQDFIRVDTLSIHQALLFVYDFQTLRSKTRVYFEDARQRRWLPKDTSSSEYRGHLMGAGSVKRDSVIWQDALTDWGIPFEMVPPRAGATKWNADTFARITGYTGRTSNHARDAALLVFGRK